jgi:23S rRNA (cytosine1962-C5)-methyltransferase
MPAGPTTRTSRTSSRDLVVLSPAGWEDYQLLDSGDGRKLERFGAHVLDRPESNAPWRARTTAWRADARFSDRWQPVVEGQWPMRYGPLDLAFFAACTPFRHTGVFPEQAAHWVWLADLARSGPNVLVLFGYTGLATLALARGGARVTHVDASRPAMTWARQNATASGLDARPVRWLLDDAMKFLRREARRGARYDGIVMDPPAFGRGPGGEVFRFGQSLPPLLEAAAAVLAPAPLLFLLNAYAVPASATMLRNLVGDLVPAGGRLEAGELALEGGGRVLATGPFARWSAA